MKKTKLQCKCDCMWCKKGDCKTCNWGCKLVNRYANTSQNNYLQVGEITACGHCDPKRFGVGLSEALSANPDFKCECVCHDTPIEKFDRELDNMVKPATMTKQPCRKHYFGLEDSFPKDKPCPECGWAFGKPETEEEKYARYNELTRQIYAGK